MNRSALIVLLVALVALYACEALKLCEDPNEEWRECGDKCPLTCRQPFRRACVKMCLPHVCQCKVGFVRRERDNRCVSLQECDENWPTEEKNVLLPLDRIK